MRDRDRRAGFSLVEAMVGLLITSVIATALAGAFLIGYRTISTEARQIAADQAISAASLPLLRDLTSATTISTGAITPGAGTLTVTYGSPVTVTTATYRIDAGGTLIRTVGTSAAVAARGIKRVTVAAGNPACAFTVTLLPSATGAMAQTLTVTQRVGSSGCF